MFMKNIETAISEINACGGIAMYEGGVPEIKDGVLGLFTAVSECEDSDGNLRTHREKYVGLLYPGIAGSISVLVKDMDTDTLFLSEPKGLTINMQHCVNLNEYKDVFNSTGRYGGPDTNVRLEEIVEFVV